MKQLEVDFLEEYKRVDRICADLFAEPNGLTRYLQEMEATPPDRRRGVDGWDAEYRTLKRLRWLRNRIAHEAGASGCEARDLGNLKRFHRDLLDGRDPLALLRAQRGRRRPRRASRRRRRLLFVFVLIALFVLAAILFARLLPGTGFAQAGGAAELLRRLAG